MHRLPLADELPYRFHPPRPNRALVRATRGLRRGMLRGEHRVEAIEVEGLDRLRGVVGRGDGVLITPNHTDRADGLAFLDLADRLGTPFCAMAAHQIFSGSGGLRHWLFPRLGIFPIDREGSDVAAVKAAVEVLTAGKYPLLVFPEGEVYHLADRLTPLRDGVAFLAATASKKLVASGKTAWVVPAAIKYRFLDGHDPLPAMRSLMGDLEARFTWRRCEGRPLIERIYRYAGAMLALKELEYFDQARSGPLKDRIASLGAFLLDAMEDRLFSKRRADPVPVRVRELRKACLDLLASPGITPQAAGQCRRDLDDLFLAIQLFSYPGDYLRESPTVERAAEVLMKFEEDVLGAEVGAPRGPRRALIVLGEPINLAAQWSEGVKLRGVVASLTAELQEKIQGLLDEIGPGRPLDAPPPGVMTWPDTVAPNPGAPVNLVITSWRAVSRPASCLPPP